MKISRSDILIFIFAIGMLVSYVHICPQIFPDAALKLELDESKIIEISKSIIEEYGYSPAPFDFNLELRRDKQQIKYLQNKFGLQEANKIIQNNDIPAYYWKIGLNQNELKSNSISISYSSGEDVQVINNKAGNDTISLNIGLDGKLTSMKVQLGHKENIDSLNVQEAKLLADSIIRKHKPSCYADFQLTDEQIERNNQRTDYTFTFKNNELFYGEKETITIGISGNYLTRFLTSLNPPDNHLNGPKRPELRAIPVLIFVVGVFILFVVIIIIKLRKDEIDIKSNIPISIIITLGWIYKLVNDIPATSDNFVIIMLIPLLITSPFIFLAILGVSSVSESYARDVWENKLLTFDMLRKRRILFPQFSLALLRGIALGFILAGILAIALKFTSGFTNAYMNFDNNNFTSKITGIPFLTFLSYGILMTGFGEFIFRLFFISSLRKWFNNAFVIVCIGGILWMFSFGDYVNLQITPYYLHQIINFILGAVIVLFFLKTDFITVWWGAFVYYLLRELFPLVYMDYDFLMWNGYSFWVLIIISIIIAFIGLRKSFDIKQIEKYTPAYIVRRAERERIQRELEIARRVQLSFLPHSKPRIESVDVASICVPANEVGGDYYDFIEIDDHKLGVVIGDVSGKGISAAFHMTLTKGFVKSQAKTKLTPREIMIQLNELFYENVERGTFISMIYGIFDLESRTFTFSRAGHNPIILQKGHADQVELLCPKGLALGLEKGEIFNHLIEEYKIGIHANDIFMFYTDGFSEAMNFEKQEFGEEQLHQIVNANNSNSAEEILENIKNETFAFIGGAPQHDDMTMLIVKIL